MISKRQLFKSKPVSAPESIASNIVSTCWLSSLSGNGIVSGFLALRDVSDVPAVGPALEVDGCAPEVAGASVGAGAGAGEAVSS